MSCNRFYRIVCYRNEEVQDDGCCGTTKVEHRYLNGVGFLSGGDLISLIQRPYNVSYVGDVVTVKDTTGKEFVFKAAHTPYKLDGVLKMLSDCACCAPESVQVFSIDSDQVTDNGDGAFSIPGVNPIQDALAFDELGNVYEFYGDFWALKSSFPTNLSEFNNDVPFVKSIQAGTDIAVDSSDPEKPIVQYTGTGAEWGNISGNIYNQLDLPGFITNNPAVAANTLKVTNATHTGDVSGATVLTIGNGKVTNPKLASVPTATLKGRVAAGSGAPTDLTPTQVRTMLSLDNVVRSDAGATYPIIPKIVSLTPLEYYQLANYDTGKIYIIPEKKAGFMGLSSSSAVQIWGDDWEYTPFTMKVNASDGSFTIPTTGTGYDYDVDWGDGNVISNYTGNAQHTYSSPGEYIVKVYGQFPWIYFNNAGDKDKLLDVMAWGDIAWGSMHSAFFGCSNLQISATDIPNLSSVVFMINMFHSCSSLTTLDVGSWDTSLVTRMDNMFYGCSSLTTLDVGSWDTSLVTGMTNMFYQTPSSLAVGIKNWSVENVTSFGNAFASSGNVIDYDQVLCNWSQQNLNPGLSIDFGNVKYSPTGAACRTDIINNHGWTITDGGPQ